MGVIIFFLVCLMFSFWLFVWENNIVGSITRMCIKKDWRNVSWPKIICKLYVLFFHGTRYLCVSEVTV